MQKVERKKSLSVCYICVVNNLCISWQLYFILSLKYMFLYMFVCMCGYICVLCVWCVVSAPHTCESQSRTPAVFLYYLPPCFLETGLLPELEVQLFQWGWRGRKLLGCSVSVPYCWVPGRQNHAGFLCGCSGSHSDSHFTH